MADGSIMIVEDESVVAQDLRQCIEGLGYRVAGIADSFDTATILAMSTTPDLALLDIRLKGKKDGIDLASDLRRQGIGFLYLTAHADPITLRRAEVTEPLGYLLKPFDSREMLPVLQMAFFRHAAEQRLRTMEHWQATTLRSIGDAVVVTDGDRRVTYANPMAERLTGWSLREALGQPLSEVLRLLDPVGKAYIECVASRAIKAEATVYLDPDIELVPKNGERLPVDDCASPVRDDDGSITGAVVVFRDASVRRRLEQERRVVERRMEDARKLEGLGSLATGVVDDLNSILTAMLGNVALCREEVHGAPLVPLQHIENQVRAAADVCRRVLAGLGSAPPNLGVVELVAIARDVVERERLRVPAGVTFELSHESERHWAKADPMQVRQVVVDLVRNGVEAVAGRDGTILVRIGSVQLSTKSNQRGAPAELSPGDYAWIEVADDGPGMQPAVVARIFEPFFTTKYSGRGLGLASVRSILLRQGGAIFVDSLVDQGSVFRAFLPQAEPPSVATTTTWRDAEKDEPLSLLLIDDDRAVLTVISRLLHSRGCTCVTAYSGAEGLLTLRSGTKVDVVMLDMMMPYQDGEETLAELRREFPVQPVLLVSGYSGVAERLRYDRHVRFLQKPFTVADAIAECRELLRSRV